MRGIPRALGVLSIAAISIRAAGLVPMRAAENPAAIRGLPFTRFYSFDEIGNLSPGPRLSFDPFGRIALVQEGVYEVLNDTVWVDIAQKEPGEAAVVQVAKDSRGTLYYGAFGSWGLIDVTTAGKLHPRSLVPPSVPGWAATSSFDDVATTDDGAYFGSRNGVVFLDTRTREQIFFPADSIGKTFVLGNRLFVSCYGQPLQWIDVRARTLRKISSAIYEGTFVDRATPLDDTRLLISTGDRRLLTFDGETFAPWRCELGEPLAGRVWALRRLLDGGFAVAVMGQGLFILSDRGEIVSALTSPEHHRITDLATNEPGVLWAATETGVEKVLYGSPVAVFGQRLGLPISWPQLVRWHDHVVVASGGRLYETQTERTDATTHFESVAEQPKGEVWGIAARGERMLVGNSQGIFARNDDGSFSPVLNEVDIARLVMVSPDFCYFLGAKTIGALRWENGRWTECAPRVAGVGYPSMVHAARNSAWLELGGSRAARVSFADGRLQVRLFEKFPWVESYWINVGVVGDTVVLSGADNGRVFFDEKTGDFCAAPELEGWLGATPYWVRRVFQDSQGTLWLTHERGVVTLRPSETGYDIDTTTFDVINDRNPNLQLLTDGDVWVSTGLSLYHLERRTAPEKKSPHKPVLVAMTHGRTTSEVDPAPLSEHASPRFPHAENSLSFRFFAGSYAARRAPAYEFKLDGGSDRWTSFGAGSPLTLPDLREGAYRLEVRLLDDHVPQGDVLSVAFEIAPPWFRTWYAYALYALSALLAITGLFRWAVHRTSRRNAELEKLVNERTGQLKITMAKLKDETRNAATLAERARLAGEIHDSVQQGLSGVMLQLDATLKQPALAEETRAKLSVARNMVSFTRHEVQNAVWDLESPLFETADLGDALKKLAELVGSGAVRAEIAVTGQSVDLTSATKHHLLRIAQEAITNAVRHADPQQIEVRLAYEPHAVSLSVADDGCGFRPQTVLAQGIGHFGLRGLRERAAKIAAELEIDSTPGRGTRIRITIPTVVPKPVESYATVS